MTELLTIETLVSRTGLEESLIRYYESEYAQSLPNKILRGDTMFFAEPAVDVFLKIHARHGELAGMGSEAASSSKRYGRVIAVTSGKGGVGKSNVSLNLAIAFQQMGKMALVLDADLGMANIHLLAGIQPAYSLKDLLRLDLEPSELITQGPEGIGIVAGGSGVIALADSSSGQRRQMLDTLEKMERHAEIIMVDTAAGMGAGVRDFLMAADEILFVLTPDITSLADAYGLLKALHAKEFNRPLYLVVNMATSLKQAADVAVRFSNCARQFLGVTINNIGYILRDATVGAATVRRTPYLIFDPQAKVSKNTVTIANALLRSGDETIRLNSAFKRYQNLIQESYP
ncbi:MAG: MinD/ParA family protein [Desulfobulbaceae bacterium]|nr:MinD/ParA family protein [Desulfobulbaceae bacterium]